MPYVQSVGNSVQVLHPLRTIDGSGTVSGEAGNFTYELRDPAGVITTTGVTVTEQGTTGYYVFDFIPDQVGVYWLSIKNPRGDFGTYDYQAQITTSGTEILPSQYWYTTLANLKERIQSTDTADDPFLQNCISRASDLCNVTAGRLLAYESRQEYVDGDGTPYLNLNGGPIENVSQVAYVTYDSNGVEQLQVISPGTYVARGRETFWTLPGYIEALSWRWTAGTRNYVVDYVAGFNPVPPFIEQACLEAAVWLWNSRKDAATPTRDVGGGALTYRDNTELYDMLNRALARCIDQRVA